MSADKDTSGRPLIVRDGGWKGKVFHTLSAINGGLHVLVSTPEDIQHDLLGALRYHLWTQRKHPSSPVLVQLIHLRFVNRDCTRSPCYHQTRSASKAIGDLALCCFCPPLTNCRDSSSTPAHSQAKSSALSSGKPTLFPGGVQNFASFSASTFRSVRMVGRPLGSAAYKV